jgi:hypothetical protein
VQAGSQTELNSVITACAGCPPRRREGSPVGPRIRVAARPGRPGRGDPGADGGQAHGPGAADQTINQARALIITGPDDIRTRFTGQAPASLVAQLAALRPRPGSMVGYHTLLSLREPGRRAQFLQDQLAGLDELIVPLVTARAPGLLSLFGVGPDTAAMLLIAAGDNPGRLGPKRPGHTCARPRRYRPPRAK